MGQKTKQQKPNLTNSPQIPQPPPIAPSTTPSPNDRIPVLTPQGVINQKDKFKALDQTAIFTTLQLDWSSCKHCEGKSITKERAE